MVYLSQDRVDLGYVGVELAKTMATPRQGDPELLLRVGKYLATHRDVYQAYPYQEETEDILVLTDSDWANCKVSRKSVSGGAMFLGNHLLEAWSRLQNKIVQSSGEAVLYSSNKGLSELAGLVNLLRPFFGDQWGRPELRTDASANRAILLRRGSGSIKHLEAKDLWGQDLIRRYAVKVRRVDRAEMHAHVLASPSSAHDFEYHLEQLGLYRD